MTEYQQYVPSLVIIAGTCLASGIVSKNADKIADIIGRFIPAKPQNRILIDSGNTHQSEMKLD